MAGYKWDRFGGIRPLASKLRLGATEAMQADNVDLHRGFLKPRAKQSAWNSTRHPSLTLASPSDEPETLFRFRDRVNTDEYWMYWESDVDVAPGPVENSEQRHYYTGDGVPKMFTKDSITDTTPPYPQAADTKYPKTWFYLGVPAPVAAPSIDGDSYVPPDTAKSGNIAGLSTPNLVIQFNPRQPSTQSTSRAMEANGANATFADSTEGGQKLMIMPVGMRLKVTEVVDSSHVKVVGTYGTGLFELIPKFFDDPVPDNRMDERWDWYYANPGDHPPNFDTTKMYKRRNGKDNDDCWVYLVPDGATLEVPGHALNVNDVIRITAVTEAMTWTTPLRIELGASYGGLNYNKARRRNLTDPDEDTIEFEGDLAYFVERDGREFDPTIEDVAVELREPTTRSYVYTYVTALGEEGPPSPPTDPFTLALGDSVSIEAFTSPPTEHRNITTYRLYRTNTGTQETAFQFVADIPIASTSYEDSLDDDELGEVLQSETWEPPPENMIGIVAMPNGFLAGFFENVLCFSEPGFPHAWPVDYRLTLEQPIVGIKVIGGSLIVATRGVPYVVAGTHPRQMASRRELEPSPCVDKRSMVDCGGVAVYVSTDGLIAGAPDGFRNLTLEHYTREQWIDFIVGPPYAENRSLRAWYKDGEYILFAAYEADNGLGGRSQVFDFRDDNQLRITQPGIAQPRAAFTDPTDGELYFVPNVNQAQPPNTIYEDSLPADDVAILRWRYLYPTVAPDPYDPDADGAYALYRSGIVMLPRPMAISVVQVLCRRARTEVGTAASFGKLQLSLLGYRYDSLHTQFQNEETDFSVEIAYVTLIRGDFSAEDFPGEQGSRPFRLDQNVLVDALSFDMSMFGFVEVEAVLVGESYDDLVRVMTA